MHHKKRGANEQAFAWNIESETVAFIETSRNGGQCECVCLSCGHPVHAKQGPSRAWHFAHATKSECGANAESALHLAAKKIILQGRRIALPTAPAEWLEPSHALRSAATLWNAKKEAEFSRVLLEQECEQLSVPPKTFKPDATGVGPNGEELFIEVYVSHAVDVEKRLKIRQDGRPAVEIDLSGYDRNLLDLEELERLVLDEVGNKSWLLPITLKEQQVETMNEARRGPIDNERTPIAESFHLFCSTPIAVRAHPGFMTVNFPCHDYLNKYIQCIGGWPSGQRDTWRMPLEAEDLLMGLLYPGWFYRNHPSNS